jgi:hypothetical protein
VQLELKMPELEFAVLGEPGVNFQHEACKLVQANTILNELIKDSVIEKYTLSEKIHVVLEQIKKLEAKNAIK